MKSRLLCLLTLGLCCASLGAQGAIVTYDFAGTVNEVKDDGTLLTLNGTIPLGTGAVGSFTYDTGVSGGSSSSNCTPYVNAITALSLNIGSGLLTWNPGTMRDVQIMMCNDTNGGGTGLRIDGSRSGSASSSRPNGSSGCTGRRRCPYSSSKNGSPRWTAGEMKTLH